MVKTIIKAFPENKRVAKNDGSSIIKIAECFSDTIQGEGVAVGMPATFLRLKGCTLNCIWCDSKEVWRKGNDYSVLELVKLFEQHGAIRRFKQGQHLVLTGGSPLKQQDSLIELIELIKDRHGFKPFIEIENECVLLPKYKMVDYIDLWNNSPKLENSNMTKNIRYKPDILKFLNGLRNSWFKFVVTSEEDWEQIEDEFITPRLISKDKIILMPEGITRDELHEHYKFCVKLACEKGVRVTDRLHITIWNRKTGV